MQVKVFVRKVIDVQLRNAAWGFYAKLNSTFRAFRQPDWQAQLKLIFRVLTRRFMQMQSKTVGQESRVLLIGNQKALM